MPHNSRPIEDSEPTLLGELKKVLRVLAAYPAGLTREELLRELRKRWPHLQPAQLEGFLRSAGAAIREEDGRLLTAEGAASAEQPGRERGDPTPARFAGRFVAFDLESVVRPVVNEPYKEQHIFQVGAVRFGPDREWVGAERFFNAYAELPPDTEDLIHRDDVLERYRQRRTPLGEVLEQFRQFCDGAEALVAYNGTAHDFPLLDLEYQRTEIERLWDKRRERGPKLVDGLYLAHALWPIPPRQHRLATLLGRLRVQVEDLQWHDALDDAKMLVALLDHGARRFLSSLDPELVSLIASTGAGSEAWELLFTLSPTKPQRRSLDGTEVALILAEALAANPSKRPLRPPREEVRAGSEGDSSGDTSADDLPMISLPDQLVDPATRTVDIDRLVRAARGERSEPRPAQREMIDRLRGWLTEGSPALVEAPTGTGKSFAVLAVALDWLAADPHNHVVISTFTKQLQNQLAHDIERLGEAVLPELVANSDVVKGARNRLSLRALVVALADLTEQRPHGRPRRQRGFSDDPRFRDLVLYLALRFLASGKPTEEWEARSVDPVDVPAFFDSYCPRQLGLYLAALSQAEAGEYGAGRNELAQYTLSVREALERRRLVVANHALLLAHTECFEDMGDHTLLVVDEAHELENAATSALSPSLDSKTISQLVRDSRDWLADQPNRGDLRQLAEAINNLEYLLDDERMQRAAMGAFDLAERDPLGRSQLRIITVASPLQGEANAEQMEHLSRELKNAARALGRLRAGLRGSSPPDDTFAADRLLVLRSRAKELDDALSGIIDSLDAVFAPSQSAPMADAAPDGDAGQTNEMIEVGDEEDELLGVEGQEEPPEEQEGSVLDEAPTGTRILPERSNRIVWAEELEVLQPGRERDFRFRVVSSPLELANERSWRRFRNTFSRAYYVSATLRVAGGWGFIRERLALPEQEVKAVTLSSPFDAAKQARLVCFEDFPSWAEHPEAAMRTVAHQLSGYAREVVDGDHNGAMVLTTSRAAAAGIFDQLARLRVAEAGNYPLTSAGIEGNQRAVEAFRREGGIVVGTRGLWQGVDVETPERLRLVWINKLPFAPFADPIVAARRELARERAEFEGAEDPEATANERYYLPLAALSLRQAVGRLIRSRGHRGVVIISDRKLAGPTRLRRLYRSVFLGSLDEGLLEPDPETGERAGGNVITMREGWRRIFAFFGEHAIMVPERARTLSEAEALERFVELPETRAIAREELSVTEEQALRAAGEERFLEELVARCERIAGHLNPERGRFELKPKQREAIRALARGKDLLAILPTGYGKSYVFQLPALALPGVTIVVSPLVSLMTDQALELNRTIGGRVRALVAPMRESNSRTGKSEVHEELLGRRSHGIKLVYLSPERLSQRQFQDWIRAGVEHGVVRRIAIDEGHTFVQWGDDFRPSFRRAERFLRELKERHAELRLLVLTATANRAVRDGLKRALFGQTPEERKGGFELVQANPLRPELAIYRRSLPQHQGGPLGIAGLIERVVDTLDDHAIFYCLTVRQVDQIHAHLSDYLQGHRAIVLKYHGRMTDTEKTAVANAFRDAPGKGEEGFRRMVVVATSAFGLGVDRPDIRTVFCVSPPTDLAALYQQLGRAGRDRAARPDSPGPFTAGMALVYPRALRTIRFMTRRQIDDSLFARMIGSILKARSPLSLNLIAEDLIQEDVRAGKLNTNETENLSTLDAYKTAVTRALAELSARELISDLGDFPSRVAIRRGDYSPDTPQLAELVEAILSEVGTGRSVDLVPLFASLAPRFPGELTDHGALWSSLLDLHTLGYLDVSQAPNRGQLTAIEVHSRAISEEIIRALSRRQQLLDRELEDLCRWFSSGECANEDFRAYFATDELPQGTCATPDCRCSSCWSAGGAEDHPPRLYEAFMATDLRPAAATSSHRRRSEQQLDGHVWHLLWHNRNGLGENLILAVLQGEDHYFNKTEGRRKRLWPSLLLSRVRGRKPGLRKTDLRASLARLQTAGEVAREGGLWQLARHSARDRSRNSRARTVAGGSGNEF